MSVEGNTGGVDDSNIRDAVYRLRYIEIKREPRLSNLLEFWFWFRITSDYVVKLSHICQEKQLSCWIFDFELILWLTC